MGGFLVNFLIAGMPLVSSAAVSTFLFNGIVSV